MIRIKIHTILTLKKVLGQRETEIEIEDGSSVKDVISWMIKRWGEALSPHLFSPGTDQLLPHIRLLVNGQDVHFLNGTDTKLRDGDELTILPMLTGG